MRRLLVLSSTYPKQEGDNVPSFVYELNVRLNKCFELHVLVPHFLGGKLVESSLGGKIYRYVYAPYFMEKLAYGGGVFANLKDKSWLYMLVVPFVAMQFLWALAICVLKRIEIIHAHWIIPQGLIAVLIKMVFGGKIKVICTSHGGDLYGLKGRFIGRIMRWVVSKCDVLTVVSSAMKNECLVRRYQPGSMKIIPMGVDLRSEFNKGDAMTSPREGWLFVGRFVEKKGITYLIEAMKLLRDEGVSVDLTMAGAGPLFEVCKQRVREYRLEDQVILLGAVGKAQLPMLYAKKEICIVPSIVDSRGDQEGLGLVIVEALGSGCIVLASDLPAIRDVIDDEKNGLLFKAGSPEAIARAILRVKNDKALRQKLSGASRGSVLEKFDWEYISQRYCQAINAAINDG